VNSILTTLQTPSGPPLDSGHGDGVAIT
jgi:hypothetical protein